MRQWAFSCCAGSLPKPVPLQMLKLNIVPFAQALLDAGARMDLPERRGWTPLMFASSCNRVNIVRELLQRGAQPNARNNDGSTALAEACCFAHSGMSMLLHAASHFIIPALQTRLLSCFAMERTSTRATSLSTHPPLLPPLYLCNNMRRYTPLMHASSRGYAAVVALLLAHSPSIQLRV